MPWQWIPTLVDSICARALLHDSFCGSIDIIRRKWRVSDDVTFEDELGKKVTIEKWLKHPRAICSILSFFFYWPLIINSLSQSNEWPSLSGPEPFTIIKFSNNMVWMLEKRRKQSSFANGWHLIAQLTHGKELNYEMERNVFVSSTANTNTVGFALTMILMVSHISSIALCNHRFFFLLCL